MGAYNFKEYSHEQDPEVAFRNLVDQARWENGHSGYTGTIAEKTSFETRTKPLLREDAEAFIQRDMLNDHDKWGPAWHVPVKNASNAVIGHLFYGSASS